MLGIYRYILAMMVALSHIWNELIWWQGIYGVFGFYVISGFLMTLILSEVYTGFSNSWRYVANRFLRIFPVYWAALIIALIIAFSSMQTLLGNNLELAYEPQTVSEFIGNFSLVVFWESRLTITQAWSLRIELVFYALMIFLCRDWRIVALWLLGSLIYCGYQINENAAFNLRYETIAGASIAFAAGSAVYHLGQRVNLSNVHLLIASVVFFGHLIFADKIWGFPSEAHGIGTLLKPHHYGLYGNIFASTYLLWAISSTAMKRVAFPRLEKFGKPLGDIAYAIFLTHWLAVLILVNLGVDFYSKPLFVPLALIVVHLISFALFRLIERPINKGLRDQIRPVEIS